MTEPLRYRDDVESLLPDEDAVIDETVTTMRHTMQQTFEKLRHQTSGTHAKSHGIVTGSLEVLADLPVELAQGLFATPDSYAVVVRYASEPGAVEPDTVQRARGLALKVLDVRGDTLREGWTSQDFLFNTWSTIPQGDAATYLNAIRARDKHFDHYLAATAATLAGHPSPQESQFDRTPNHHPVGYRYYSQGAFRHGDFVAKYAFVPVSDAAVASADREVTRHDPPGVLRDLVHDFYAAQGATYALQVQLCTDLGRMPVEDASTEWPEDESPYVTVATVTLPAQESFSPARRTYAEDVLSWRPWFGLAAHRPLGSINRVRNRVYAELGAYRHEQNARTEENPTSLTQVPD
ncbi:MAG: catalase [Propionibacteriaceae bacterium]|nr:MAG: catalase [Propionibacteriaceae bacterium]